MFMFESYRAGGSRVWHRDVATLRAWAERQFGGQWIADWDGNLLVRDERVIGKLIPCGDELRD
jgi:hypothetical protein